jgi:gliding motility-associated lipoprotein GldD
MQTVRNQVFNMLKIKKPVKVLTLIISFFAACFFAGGCNSDYSPKPAGYFKIDLPKRAYQVFDRQDFPYSFEYPVYATIIQDTTFFEEKPENPYWINIDFPRFNGRIYISYNIIGGRAKFKVKKGGDYVDSVGVNSFERLIKGSYDLTFKHTYKASSIEDSVFRTANGVEGIYFKIGGNTATSNQFLVTDSVKHFLRGALYFDATPNEDSLSVVNNFLQQDMKHLINTLKWKN